MAPRDWSVRTRLSAVSTLSAVVGLGAAAVAAYAVTSSTLHQQVDESLRGAPGLFSAAEERRIPPAAELCRALGAPVTPSPGLFSVLVIEAGGQVCQSTADNQVRVLDADRALARDGGAERLRDGELADGSAARVSVVALPSGGALVIARDITSVRSVLATLAGTLALVVLLGAVVALALSRWTTKAALRPIARFAAVAEDIAATGRLEDHVAADPLSGAAGRAGDELDRLSRAFASMTAVLSDAQSRQRRLVADAGHELRTPLTSLRANIALLARSRRLQRPLAEDEEARLLDDLGRQAGELSLLVDDLAELAADDLAEPTVEVLRFDLCVERALRRAARRVSGHSFEVALEPWVVEGDEAALQRAVVNLLDNAIKFSPPGSVVHVSLARGVMRVTDQGGGLTDAEAAQALERFWRSPRARSLPGSGLGLSIADDVARRHHGWVRLERAEPVGTVATLFVPGFESHDASPDVIVT